MRNATILAVVFALALVAALYAVEPVTSAYKVSTSRPTSMGAINAEIKEINAEMERLEKYRSHIGPVDANAKMSIVRDSEGAAIMCKTEKDKTGETSRFTALMAPLDKRRAQLGQWRFEMRPKESQPAK